MQFARPLDQGLEVRADYNINTMTFDLYFINRHWQDRALDTVAVPLTFVPKEPRADHLTPVVRLSEEEAQYMMDRLWAEGLRPKHIGGAGELQAVKDHLRDMRRLAFTELQTEEPK